MVSEQETLIYIENQEKLDASAAANAFAHQNIKNRAYINTLGAELALKYLASEDIDTSNIYNIHSIKKILEEMDIADIMLSNIHIDARVVFDENIIFIPKTHFQYNLTPDIYLVFNLAKDFSYAKLLGFFEPKLINKNNSNDKYYFIEKEKLNSIKDLKQYIEAHKGDTAENLSEQDYSNSEQIIIAMTDNDVSEDEKKYLIKQLTKSALLRNRFIEYENFETLSYKAMTDPKIKRKKTEEDASPSIEINSKEPVDNTIDSTDKSTDILDTEATAIGGIATAGTTAIEASAADITVDTAATLAETLGEIVTNAARKASNAPQNTTETISDKVAENDVSVEINELNTEDANTPVDVIKLNSDNITIKPEIINNDSIVEPLSFDNIDTSSLENIVLPEKEIKEETISFQNIDLPETTPDTDFINEIDNKITFDDINIQEEIAEPEIMDTEKISLNEIDVSDMKPFEDNTNYTEETISFDNVATTNIPASIDNENTFDNTLSFNDIPDDVPQETDNSDQKIDSFSNTDEIETFDNDFMDDNMSFDGNEPENTETLNDVNDIIAEPAEEITENVIENPETNNSFGKNLIENLSAENFDDISLENLDLNDANMTNAENISSNDLLSEIDNILNSTEQKPSDIPDTTEILSDGMSEILSDNLSSSSEASITGEQEPANIVQNFTQDNTEVNEDFTAIDELLNTDILDNTGALEQLEDDSIKVLFNDDDSASDTESYNQEYIEELPNQNVPGGALINKKSSGNKWAFLVAVVLVTVLAAAAAIIVLKPKNDNTEDIEPLVPKNEEIADNPAAPDDSSENLATNVPDIKDAPVTSQPAAELTSTVQKPRKNSSASYSTVSKIVWDVPDSISYSPKIQEYLRTAGRSIKLSLSADLLLATEYAYTNQVKVSLTLSNNGNIEEAKITSSSGSTQIDNIVLQSVKDTLNVVKPPSNEIKTQDFNLSLIIYL